MLDRLGIKVPDAALYGISLNWSSYVSDIYIIRYLKKARTLEDSTEALRENNQLFKVLDNMASDLNTMILHNILFADLHFGNIMISDSNEIYWIDTAAKTERNDIKFRDKLSNKLKVLHYGKSNTLTESEWNHFQSRLNVA